MLELQVQCGAAQGLLAHWSLDTTHLDRCQKESVRFTVVHTVPKAKLRVSKYEAIERIGSLTDASFRVIVIKPRQKADSVTNQQRKACEGGTCKLSAIPATWQVNVMIK